MRRLKGSRGGSKEEEVQRRRRFKGGGGSKEEEVKRRRRFKGVKAGSWGISRDGPMVCSWLGSRKLEELLKEKDTEG
jgi:hypothetical protein